MRKVEVLEIVKNLKFDTDTTIFTDSDSTELYINRPSKLSKRFSNYDVNKNFQIWMRLGDRKFRPNHLRLLIDLNLRVRSRPDLKRKLLLAFDNIFYGSDPDEVLEELAKDKFDHYLNSIKLIGHLAQIFFVEQEYAYSKESNYLPPTLFLQGWIRQFIDSPDEIDNLTMSVANRRPPAEKYVDKENKKSKNHVEGLRPLWYLQ
ncbi:MAG: hypothetical protein BK997_01095 [Candidatus Micrarchaeum sp. ARMAN-1]|nr:MAG: hypothetical protein BK997_01095 [Candidatus Micrarchaeum sp. ARMAN-1]